VDGNIEIILVNPESDTPIQTLYVVKYDSAKLKNPILSIKSLADGAVLVKSQEKLWILEIHSENK